VQLTRSVGERQSKQIVEPGVAKRSSWIWTTTAVTMPTASEASPDAIARCNSQIPVKACKCVTAPHSCGRSGCSGFAAGRSRRQLSSRRSVADPSGAIILDCGSLHPLTFALHTTKRAASFPHHASAEPRSLTHLPHFCRTLSHSAERSSPGQHDGEPHGFEDPPAPPKRAAVTRCASHTPPISTAGNRYGGKGCDRVSSGTCFASTACDLGQGLSEGISDSFRFAHSTGARYSRRPCGRRSCKARGARFR